MLSETIKTIRKSKGLSQQALAERLNVVRQTISKWEQGLSVPDSEQLLLLSKVLETPVSTLLGENGSAVKDDTLSTICQKLEDINLEFARKKAARKRLLHFLFIALCALTAAVLAVLLKLKSPYLGWDYGSPETAVLGVAFHSLEWLFVRTVPVVLIGAGIGTYLTRKKA